MKPVKIAVIGCGGIAQMMHLPYLCERQDLFSVVCLVDADVQRARAVAARVGLSRVEAAPVWTDDFEAVLICTSGDHGELVLAALDAGKAVLAEKPLTLGRACLER